jgi:hypothetical protein
VRRLGFVDVVAVAASSDRSAETKARALGVPKSYGSYEALAADLAVDVVHVTTPNALHGGVMGTALANRKHVVCDKPLARTPDEARRLRRGSHRRRRACRHVQLRTIREPRQGLHRHRGRDARHRAVHGLRIHAGAVSEQSEEFFRLRREVDRRAF